MEFGLRQFGRDLLQRRYRFRQFAGGVFAGCTVMEASPRAVAFCVGLPLVVLGALVRMWAAGHVRKSKELATHGPYAFVRHPQYLGNSLLAVGLSVASGHPWGIAVWLLVLWLFYIPAIRREDDKLRRRFGESWEKWAKKAPAVVPTGWPQSNPGVHLSDWSPLQAVRNGEPIWTTCMMATVVLILRQLP